MLFNFSFYSALSVAFQHVTIAFSLSPSFMFSMLHLSTVLLSLIRYSLEAHFSNRRDLYFFQFFSSSLLTMGEIATGDSIVPRARSLALSFLDDSCTRYSGVKVDAPIAHQLKRQTRNQSAFHSLCVYIFNRLSLSGTQSAVLLFPPLFHLFPMDHSSRSHRSPADQTPMKMSFF